MPLLNAFDPIWVMPTPHRGLASCLHLRWASRSVGVWFPGECPGSYQRQTSLHRCASCIVVVSPTKGTQDKHETNDEHSDETTAKQLYASMICDASTVVIEVSQPKEIHPKT